MAFEHYVISGGKKLRCGYTTGSCAALGAQAACKMLFSGSPVSLAALDTPKGLRVEAEVLDAKLSPDQVSCAIRKDGGDDCDATDGALIYVSVRRIPRGIVIDGGEGVGVVTRPGLDQPVGSAAINRVPRHMIEHEVAAVCAAAGYGGGVQVTVSVPEGEAIAKRTFNPNLGITGGISILGTTGIVEPMSLQSLIDSIDLELRVHAAEGNTDVILVPGNYGSTFLAARPGFERFPQVQFSNFFGDALDFAAADGYKTVLVVSHMGKLVKVAGGIMNTHSRFADCRTELFAAYAALCGASQETVAKLMDSATSDACIALLDEAGLRETVLEKLMDAVQRHLERRAGGVFQVGAVGYSNEYGLLGVSSGGRAILEKWGLEL